MTGTAASSSVAFSMAFFWAMVSVGILVHERMRMGASEDTQAADTVLAGVLISFLPVVLLLLARMVFPLTFPFSVAMLWFVVFPVSVAIGADELDYTATGTGALTGGVTTSATATTGANNNCHRIVGNLICRAFLGLRRFACLRVICSHLNMSCRRVGAHTCFQDPPT